MIKMSMKTKILYVLVSTNDDIFAEQTYLSLLSLKKHNESCSVSLLIDNKTAKSLKNRKFDLVSLVDEPIIVDMPEEMTNKYKSRVLKTSMRNYVEGDFLYVDSDTIILSDLSEIDKEQSDMAAVYEYNRPFCENTNKKTLAEIYERTGQDINQIKDYFNSGVIYVKDNSQTRSFFKDWFSEWEKETKKGVFFDQPSLGIVNSQKGNYINALDGSWNCQGRYCLNYIHSAKIYHYLFDKGYDFPMLKKDAFFELKENGVVNHMLESVLVDPFKYIGSKNLIITGNDVIIRNSRLYAIVKTVYRHRKFYMGLEKILNGIYSVSIRLKKRNLAPPR